MPNTPLNDYHTRLLIATIIATTMAFFDYLLVAYLKDIIIINFFGGHHLSWLLLVQIVGLFVGAYLSYPIGGLLFGQYGDIHGRRAVLSLSLLGLAIFTFIMAFLPTYEGVGILAPFLFLVARFGQGLAFGGQAPATLVLLTEQLPMWRVGFACGLILAGALAGLLGANFFTLILNDSLSYNALLSYGWRVPFFIGGIFSIIPLLLLKNIQEAPTAKQTNERHTDEEHTLSTMSFDGLTKKQVQRLDEHNIFYHKSTDVKPFAEFFSTNNLSKIIPAVLVSWVIFSVFIVIGMILPDLLNINFVISEVELTFGAGISTFFMMIGCVFYGYLADRTNVGQLMLCGGILLIINTTLFFAQLNFGSSLMLVWFAFLGFSGGMIATLPAILTRLFPTKIRLTSIALTYNITYVVVAGGLPFLLSLAAFYLPLASALYLLLIGLMMVFLGLYFYYLPRSESNV